MITQCVCEYYRHTHTCSRVPHTPLTCPPSAAAHVIHIQPQFLTFIIVVIISMFFLTLLMLECGRVGHIVRGGGDVKEGDGVVPTVVGIPSLMAGAVTDVDGKPEILAGFVVRNIYTPDFLVIQISNPPPFRLMSLSPFCPSICSTHVVSQSTRPYSNKNINAQACYCVRLHTE